MNAYLGVGLVEQLIASVRAWWAINRRVIFGGFGRALHGCPFRALKTASTAFNALDSVLVVALLFKALVSA